MLLRRITLLMFMVVPTVVWAQASIFNGQSNLYSLQVPQGWRVIQSKYADGYFVGPGGEEQGSIHTSLKKAEGSLESDAKKFTASNEVISQQNYMTVNGLRCLARQSTKNFHGIILYNDLYCQFTAALPQGPTRFTFYLHSYCRSETGNCNNIANVFRSLLNTIKWSNGLKP